MRSRLQIAIPLIAVLLSFFVIARADTSQVEVTADENQQSASIVQLSKTVTVSPASACVTPNELKAYPNTFSDFAKSATCTTGYLQSTILSEKINDIQGSIASVNGLLASLGRTQIYLSSFSADNLNGLSLEAIPAGIDEPHAYPSASNIAMMCLNDAGQGIKNDLETVGSESSDSANIFNPLPSIALQNMQKLRDNNTNMKNLLNSISLGGTWGYLTSGRATIDAQAALMGKTMSLSQANQAIATQYLIPITLQDLAQNYQPLLVNKQYIYTSVTWLNNKRELKDLTSLPKDIMKVINTYVPIAQVPKSATHMQLTIDNDTVTGWLPEADIWNQLESSIATHKAQYLKLKASYQTQLIALQAQQALLIANNYNCQ